MHKKSQRTQGLSRSRSWIRTRPIPFCSFFPSSFFGSFPLFKIHHDLDAHRMRLRWCQNRRDLGFQGPDTEWGQRAARAEIRTHRRLLTFRTHNRTSEAAGEAVRLSTLNPLPEHGASRERSRQSPRAKREAHDTEGHLYPARTPHSLVRRLPLALVPGS